MNRAPTWVRPAANGRADHPWLAAVEQGCSTLPRDRGQHVVLSLPRDSYVVTRCCPYLARRSRVGELLAWGHAAKQIHTMS